MHIVTFLITDSIQILCISYQYKHSMLHGLDWKHWCYIIRFYKLIAIVVIKHNFMCKT